MQIISCLFHRQAVSLEESLYRQIIRPSWFNRNLTPYIEKLNPVSQNQLWHSLAQRCAQEKVDSVKIIQFLTLMKAPKVPDEFLAAIPAKIERVKTELKCYELIQKRFFDSTIVTGFFATVWSFFDSVIEAYAYVFGIKQLDRKPQSGWEAAQFLSALGNILTSLVGGLKDWITGWGIESGAVVSGLVGVGLALLAVLYGAYRNYLQPAPKYAPSCENLTQLANQGKIRTPAPGFREDDLAQLIEALEERSSPVMPMLKHPCLIAPSGSGKSELVNALAYKIAKNEVPDFLKGVQVFKVNAASITSAPELWGRGEALKSIFAAAVENPMHAKKAIFFIDELHALDATLLELLKSELEGVAFFIGATTESEFEKSISSNQPLRNRLREIRIKPAEDNLSGLVAILRHYVTQNAPHLYVTTRDLVDFIKKTPKNRAIAQPKRSLDALETATQAIGYGYKKGSTAEELRGLKIELENLRIRYECTEQASEKKVLDESIRELSLRIQEQEKSLDQIQKTHDERMRIQKNLQHLHRSSILALPKAPVKAYLLEEYFLPEYKEALEKHERMYPEIETRLVRPSPMEDPKLLALMA